MGYNPSDLRGSERKIRLIQEAGEVGHRAEIITGSADIRDYYLTAHPPADTEEEKGNRSPGAR